MTPPLTVSPSPDNNVSEAADRRLSGILRRRRLDHAVVTLVSGDGRQRWAAGFGPAGPGDPFFIASVTKRFVVALVLQAYGRKELDLNAPITAYLPASVTGRLHVLRGVDRTDAVTVRHLAAHTSGLPDHFEKRSGGPTRYDLLAAGQDAEWTFEDVIGTIRDQQRPHFPPQDMTAARQRARYSDSGFQLLIRIVETVTGRTFAELLADRITGPLGLRHTWLPGDVPPDGAGPLPIHDGRRPVDLTRMIRSSNDLISTAGDLVAFQRALIGGELFGDTGPLTERRNRLRNIPMLRYGLGTMFFRVGRLMSAGRRPVTLIGHSGATGTWLFHCPELDLHLAGTVDQTRGQAAPFPLMARCLDAWVRR